MLLQRNHDVNISERVVRLQRDHDPQVYRDKFIRVKWTFQLKPLKPWKYITGKKITIGSKVLIENHWKIKTSEVTTNDINLSPKQTLQKALKKISGEEEWHF